MGRLRARSAGGGRPHSFVHDGHRLAYEVHGEGQRLLLYMHGLLLDANLNRPIARALAEQGNRVVLLDLLGHGASDKPAHASEYRMDLYADQVFALLDELGAPEAVLGGLSLGANVSLLAASRQPDRVRGLVVEMPVLERATPSVALTFVPLLLTLHYAHRPAWLLTRAVRHLPRSGFGPLDSVLDAVSLDPDQMAAVLHGVLLGPVRRRRSRLRPRRLLGQLYGEDRARRARRAGGGQAPLRSRMVVRRAGPDHAP